MITTIRLINTPITSHSYHCVCVCGENIQDPLSKQVSKHNRVLCTTVTISTLDPWTWVCLYAEPESLPAFWLLEDARSHFNLVRKACVCKICFLCNHLWMFSPSSGEVWSLSPRKKQVAHFCPLEDTVCTTENKIRKAVVKKGSKSGQVQACKKQI